MKERPTYPSFDHNGRKVAAWNYHNMTVGESGYLTYHIDERGHGHYQIEPEPLKNEIRYNNRITQPDTPATITEVYGTHVVWVEREI